jgi:hypothetical protein
MDAVKKIFFVKPFAGKNPVVVIFHPDQSVHHAAFFAAFPSAKNNSN